MPVSTTAITMGAASVMFLSHRHSGTAGYTPTPVEMAVLFTLGGIAFFGVGLWLIFRTPDTWERSNPWAEIFGGILALVAGAILILNAFIVFAR